MEPGIYANISNADYHAGPGYSKSQLDLATESPALVLWSKRAPRSFTDAGHIGTALHSILLEPHLFWDQYAVGPECGRRSNADKDRWEEFERSLAGRIALTVDEYDDLNEMRESVLAHPEAAGLLRLPSAVPEQSAYWLDRTTGLLCRCRPDLWAPAHGVIVDVKSTEDIHRFKWSIRDYRYDVQDAFYRDGVEAATGVRVDAFLFLVVGKKREMGRYPVRVFELDAHDVASGHRKYQQDLAVIAECERTGIWPGIQSISIPQRSY